MPQTPSYTSEPGLDERRLDIASPNAPAPKPSSGTLIQPGSGIDIALCNQEEAARHATYGRGASVVGEVSLSTTHGVTSVHITLDGKLESTSSRTTRPHLQIVHVSFTLWEKGGTDVCPSTLPFTFVMPETFVDSESGSTYPLPPSYDSAFEVQDMQVRCVYQLLVRIERSHWVPNKSTAVDINYVPRTLAARDIREMSIPSFHSINSFPKDWYRMSSVLAPKPHSTSKPIDCQFFVPSARVFAMQDVIPFFLQLRGDSLSMLALYGSGQLEEGWTQRLLHLAEHAHLAPRIAVTIKRQVHIDARAHPPIMRSYIIGTGSVRPVPPEYLPPVREGSSEPVTAGYEGDIRFIPSLSTSSFDTGKLSVSDFVVLSIEPQGTARHHFDNLTHSEGVRIVTG